MTVYKSTKLLLIGIIKNYNRDSFILAVISFAPASINIVSGGLPIRGRTPWSFRRRSRSVATITATADLSSQAQGSMARIEPYFDAVGGTRFRELPDF
jgi:hypothetical protein